MMHLPLDLREFLRSLNDAGVEYLIVGGFAVIHHGYARATDDLDVWVKLAPENAERTATALRSFGYDLPEVTAALFLEPERIVRMGRAPQRIEVLTTIAGVTFDECYAARELLALGELVLPLLSLEHLKRNKAASGRAKDLADLENLP